MSELYPCALSRPDITFESGAPILSALLTLITFAARHLARNREANAS